MPVPPTTFSEPPTVETLRHAQLHLESTCTSIRTLAAKIASAEMALTEFIGEAKLSIMKMTEEKMRLEEDEVATRSYLSPARRLPAELLREIFLWYFEGHEACAWVLAAVCSSWRSLALRTPKLWAKIRLFTTPTSSPELIRLWLERSGHNTPLDIEIYLRAAEHPCMLSNPCLNFHIDPQRRRGRRPYGFGGSMATSWPYFASHNGSISSIPHSDEPREVFPNLSNKPDVYWAHIAFYYLVAQMPRWERFVFRYDKAFKAMTALASINGVAPLLKEFEVSSSEGGCSPDWPWLPNIPIVPPGPRSPPFLPSLMSLTLHQVPFRWSSPIFSLSHLRHLNLRAPVSPALPLDRIRFMISHNPHLQSLVLYFQGVLPNVLPLASLVIREVTEVRIGGHWLLGQLVDCLSTPKLKKLSLSIDPRESAEDVIIGLLTRSATALSALNPLPSQSTQLTAGAIGDIKLEELSLGYDTPPGPNLFSPSHPFILPAGPSLINHPHIHTHMNIHAMYHYYVPSPTGIIPSWRTLLVHLPHLRVLKVGGMPLEALLVCLANNEDDGTGLGGAGGSAGNGNNWLSPNLEVLMLRGWCSNYGYGGSGSGGSSNGAGYGMGGSEVVAKLVVAIESRNADSGSVGLGGGWGGSTSVLGLGGNSSVKRLKHLEMHDCDLGVDVERWLEGRIERVICVDPPLLESAQVNETEEIYLIGYV